MTGSAAEAAAAAAVARRNEASHFRTLTAHHGAATQWM